MFGLGITVYFTVNCLVPLCKNRMLEMTMEFWCVIRPKRGVGPRPWFIRSLKFSRHGLLPSKGPYTISYVQLYEEVELLWSKQASCCICQGLMIEESGEVCDKIYLDLCKFTLWKYQGFGPYSGKEREVIQLYQGRYTCGTIAVPIEVKSLRW